MLIGAKVGWPEVGCFSEAAAGRRWLLLEGTAEIF